MQVHDSAYSEELQHQQQSIITLQTQEILDTQASLDVSTQTCSCTAEVGTETVVSLHQLEVECNALNQHFHNELKSFQMTTNRKIEVLHSINALKTVFILIESGITPSDFHMYPSLINFNGYNELNLSDEDLGYRFRICRCTVQDLGESN